MLRMRKGDWGILPNYNYYPWLISGTGEGLRKFQDTLTRTPRNQVWAEDIQLILHGQPGTGEGLRLFSKRHYECGTRNRGPNYQCQKALLSLA